MTQRLHPHPYLSLFNGADAKLTTDVRDASTVASQALFMANGDLIHEQAAKFARRPEDQRGWLSLFLFSNFFLLLLFLVMVGERLIRHTLS